MYLSTIALENRGTKGAFPYLGGGAGTELFVVLACLREGAFACWCSSVLYEPDDHHKQNVDGGVSNGSTLKCNNMLQYYCNVF